MADAREWKPRPMLARLHEADPACRVCGRHTRLLPPMKRSPRDSAVFARIRPKGAKVARGENVRTLMCWQCANDRDREATLARPRAELWAASRSPPLGIIGRTLITFGIKPWWRPFRKDRRTFARRARA